MKKFFIPLRNNMLNRFLILLFCGFFVFSIISCEREISVTPPDEPPPDGFLLIDSWPDGASIYINGRDRRRITPDSVTWFETGDYEVTLKKEFFRDTAFYVHVTEGERSEIFIDYLSNPSMLGNINCISNPGGALITLDDSNTSFITPFTVGNLIPGYHSVKYSMDNHRDKEVTVIVRSNQTTNAEATLVDTTIWMDYNTSNSGLPSNDLTCVLSDSRGVLWIGTYTDGLVKYINGSWVNYLESNSDLSDNITRCIGEDPYGNIWVGMFDGLTEIIPSSNTSFAALDDILFKWNFRNSSLLSMRINGIASNENGEMWFGTDLGITQLFVGEGGGGDSTASPRLNLLTSSMLDNGMKAKVMTLMDIQYNWGPSLNSVSSSLPDDRATAVAMYGNTKYIGTKNGFVKFSNSQNMSVYKTTNGLFRNSVSTIAVARDGDVWVGHKSEIHITGGLSRFDGVGWTNLSHLIYGEDVSTIFIDSHNSKWVGTNKALYIIKNMNQVQRLDIQSTGLDFQNVRGVTEDLSGNIWIVTLGNGLVKAKASKL
ncbi:MAG: hypothetical protein A2V66_03130 [Ignavibacteria bacterium RBG_13_36_8]|nr:MAG: hypothetical protein A2V66_03130 [Ignavibacteria bacterium RBG_13_36_8]